MNHSISVIITYCKADEHLLGRCIDSVRWQLTPEDELIIVGDGTSPDLLIVDGAQTMTVGSINKPAGVSAARNAGIRAAKGAWIKFIDVDDLLAPFALNVIRKLMPKPVVFGAMHFIHNGIFQGTRKPYNSHTVQCHIKSVNIGLLSAAVLQRRALEIAGIKFDERIHFEEDWDLWLKLYGAMGGAAAFGSIEVPFCYYTRDDAVQAEKDKTRSHLVEGIDVREYFRQTYGCTPV